MDTENTTENDAGGADAVASALEAMAAVGDETAEDARELAQRSRRAGEERVAGATLSDSMATGRPQEILGLTEKMAKRLLASGSALRKALVSGLTKEGWGVSAVSRLFGVSHQRISTLLQQSRHKE